MSLPSAKHAEFGVERYAVGAPLLEDLHHSLIRADHFDDQCVVPSEAVAMITGDMMGGCMMEGTSMVQGRWVALCKSKVDKW